MFCRHIVVLNHPSSPSYGVSRAPLGTANASRDLEPSPRCQQCRCNLSICEHPFVAYVITPPRKLNEVVIAHRLSSGRENPGVIRLRSSSADGYIR